MKKIKALLCIIISILLTVCSLALLHNRSKPQTVFSCLRTALQKDNVFALRNAQTENVYILKTDKKQQTAALYRRTAEGKLKRYTVFENIAEVSVTGSNGWLHEKSFELPANPYSLLTQLQELFEGNNESTQVLKKYIDYLFSFLSGVNNDSSLLIDYNALPAAFRSLKDFITDKENIHHFAINKTRNGTETTHILTFPSDEEVQCVLIEILLSAIQNNQQEFIRTYITPSDLFLKDCTIHVTQDFFGRFQKLEIYQEDECSFYMEKLN